MKQPLAFFWDGQFMVPLLRFTKEAQRRFTVGEQYKMRPEFDRSVASHNSYFAEIDTQWRKIRDYKEYPTSEHLRRTALIMRGYYNERWQEFSTPCDAAKVGQLISLYLTFEMILVRENKVIVRTAQSQSRSVMGEADFKESKKAVLEFIEDVVRDAEIDQSGRWGAIDRDGTYGGPR